MEKVNHTDAYYFYAVVLPLRNVKEISDRAEIIEVQSILFD